MTPFYHNFTYGLSIKLNNSPSYTSPNSKLKSLDIDGKQDQGKYALAKVEETINKHQLKIDTTHTKINNLSIKRLLKIIKIKLGLNQENKYSNNTVSSFLRL